MPENNLIAHHYHKGRKVGTYRIVMTQPFMPESALQKTEPELPTCDACGSAAEWFGNGERYCGKHGPGRKGRG